MTAGRTTKFSYPAGARLVREVADAAILRNRDRRPESREPHARRKARNGRIGAKGEPSREIRDAGATGEILVWIRVYCLCAGGASLFGLLVGLLLRGTGLK
jgi:hypothetical protein